MVVALLLLLAASTPGSSSDFANPIPFIEQRAGCHIGVAALDTGSGKRLDHRSEERFPMCSTFKFLAAAAVLKRVDEKQQQLDDSYVMTQKTSWNMPPSRKHI
jgi:beta-lactamase class A